MADHISDKKDQLRKQRSILLSLNNWEDEVKQNQSSRDLIAKYQRSCSRNLTDEIDPFSPRAQDPPPNKDNLMSDIHTNSRVTENMRSKVDECDMSRVTADAGINTFGCIFLEVWALNKDRTRLTRPAGGAWMDTAFRTSLPSEEQRCVADHLIDHSSDTAIGVGLPGTIFAEKSGHRIVQWRQIKSIMTDPFKQRDPTERMVKIFSIGIGLVAFTTFTFGCDSGVVLFYTRSSRGFDKRSDENERIMLEYTDLIGTTFAMIRTRNECARMRRKMLKDAVMKVRTQLIKNYSEANRSIERLGAAVLDKNEMARLKVTLEEVADEEENRNASAIKLMMKRLKKTIQIGYKKAVMRVKSSPKKWSGVHVYGPPRHTFMSSISSFTWVFVAMLMILKISTSIQDTTYAFDASWYSSTLCILMALTPAPVGQPRQIFAAHLWNMMVGMLLELIPTGEFTDFLEWREVGGGFGMPLIWKQALSVAVGVSGQAFLGILHPPATGLSLAFVTHPKWSWVRIPLCFSSSHICLAVSVALTFNPHICAYRAPCWQSL